METVCSQDQGGRQNYLQFQALEFQYDPLSYELNFDDGSQQEEDFQRQDTCESVGHKIPGKSLKYIQKLHVIVEWN